MGVRHGAVEKLAMRPDFWHGKRVFLTGHTGFKGGWLALWLQHLGAQVHGYSSLPPSEPNLFTAANVETGLASSTIADVRDAAALKNAMLAAAPDVVFHLAAQPLVRYSYVHPVETYAVNVLGTVNLLEAVRSCGSVRAIVNVTTDKCYDNKEWAWGYRENEPLGGRDPYSSSKACSELVTAAYRDSFLAAKGVAVATARAGNVIGGGDWAQDRLLPDFFRAIDQNRTMDVRHPEATRPWQHVLEPVYGYMLLAEALSCGANDRTGAWNFGPRDEDARSVRWILDYLTRRLPEASWRHVDGAHVHEAHYLKLDSSKAVAQLGWAPRWSLDQALDHTLQWHVAWKNGRDMRALCLEQIATYTKSDRHGSIV